MGMTIVASPDNVVSDAMMRLREGTAGQFANLVLIKRGNIGIENDQCFGTPTTTTRPVAFAGDVLFVDATKSVIMYVCCCRVHARAAPCPQSFCYGGAHSTKSP